MAFFNKKAEKLIKLIKLIELIKLNDSELFHKVQTQSTNQLNSSIKYRQISVADLTGINHLPNPFRLFVSLI
jgi:hypothetical protein